MQRCPHVGYDGLPLTLESGRVWAEGNILLGGGGNDLIEGRGNDDIVDGDHALRVAITVRTNRADPASEIGRTDLMEHQATSGNFGTGTTGMTLQQAVFAGLVDPGNLVAVREIVDPTGSRMGPTAYTGVASGCPAPTADPPPTPGAVARTVKLQPGTVNCDTAAFLDQTVTVDLVTGALDPAAVRHRQQSLMAASRSATSWGLRQRVTGWSDTLWNVENLRFCVG